MTETTTAPKAKKPRKPRQPIARRVTDSLPVFDELPVSAWARQVQLIRDPKRPSLPTPLPFSAATLWRKVREGTFPAPVRLGPAITAWRVGDVRAWMQSQSEAA